MAKKTPPRNTTASKSASAKTSKTSKTGPESAERRKKPGAAPAPAETRVEDIAPPPETGKNVVNATEVSEVVAASLGARVPEPSGGEASESGEPTGTAPDTAPEIQAAPAPATATEPPPEPEAAPVQPEPAPEPEVTPVQPELAPEPEATPAQSEPTPKPEAALAQPAPEAAPEQPEPTSELETAFAQPKPDLEPEIARVEPEPPAPEPQPEVHPFVYRIPSMYIVHITPELAPVAKVGGLADVVFGLVNEMEIRGNHVEIILPKYDCLRYDHIWGLCETYGDLWVPWYGGAIHCTVYFGFVHGRKCFFIEPHSSDNFFNRGCIYGFNDDVLRFAFFSRAAMEFLWKSGKHPDIIHCHDWQTALVPVFLFEVYKYLGMTHSRVCFTIHNFKHQGVTGAQLLHATGLNRPEYYAHYDRLRDNFNPHAINLMKGGVVYSNFVTTVSPRHASEAKDQGQGFGLEPTLHIHHMKFGGVVNGIDYNAWNPEIDRYIPFHYGIDTVEEKYGNKKALRDRLMIADSEKPIVAFVGRLDPQKGLELIRHAIFYTLHRRGQFVLLGSSPDGQINNYFWGLKHQLNDNPDVHIEIGFNEELSHLIYAGADIMLVPSRFEPCGLTQLIAMKYGTVPVVREVGGLADTVFDKDYSYKPLHERNGYIFRDYDYSGLESALGRAISCYYDYPDHFRELMKNGMRYDFSWKNPGQDYLNIYDYIREK
jgi:starch synthase